MSAWSGILGGIARAAGRRPRRAALLLAAAMPGLWLGVNWGYHVWRQPAELPGLLAPALVKTPRQTWASYAAHFRAYSTTIVSPELLAALAHAESGGSPLARPAWRWRWSWHPFEVYAPASSATGLYQITDATFEEARRFCVRQGRVVEPGPWHDLGGCWFNGLRSRLLPGHAVELAAAHLDVSVRQLLAERGRRHATPGQLEALAAVVHLCGRQRGADLVRRGFQLAGGESCGSHDLRRYVSRVRALQQFYARLAAVERRGPVAGLTPPGLPG
jgi:hypothetical protein